IHFLIMIVPDIIFRVLHMIFGDTLFDFEYFPAVFGAMFFIWDIGFINAITGLIRRVKAHKVLENSIFIRVKQSFHVFINGIADNANVAVGTWIPVLYSIAINIIAIRNGVLGIGIACVYDLLIGLYIYTANKQRKKIVRVIEDIDSGYTDSKVDTQGLHGQNLLIAKAVNSIGEGMQKAVNTSIKDERLKSELITNVSHDIRTPLTSIINYINLIKREDIDNIKVQGYINILEEKAYKLKQLTDDLVETTKIESGNFDVNFARTNIADVIEQFTSEFQDKFDERGLKPLFKAESKDIIILADSRLIWRVLDNLFTNVYKYAMENTRVYMELGLYEEDGKKRTVFSIKNISASELSYDADEIGEKFIRGDMSRNSEGAGLGLSIAKSLTFAQKGKFDIVLDGDLFKVVMDFEVMEE
nr:HAMP domain-containing histidine kinase [Butyrivibrio sp.]